MRALVERIGPSVWRRCSSPARSRSRSIVRTQAFAAGSAGAVACTVGEIAFLVVAAVPFFHGMRKR